MDSPALSLFQGAESLVCLCLFFSLCLNQVKAGLTERPDEVVLWPQSQHGHVKVDDLQVEWCGGDEVILYGALHRDELTQQQIDHQRDGTRAQLGDHVILGAGEREERVYKGLVLLKLSSLNCSYNIILFSTRNHNHIISADTSASNTSSDSRLTRVLEHSFISYIQHHLAEIKTNSNPGVKFNY